MDQTTKDRLKAKIKGKYDLPAIVDGQNVDVALEFQRKSLYRSWRYRLKEEFYIGFTQRAAEANRPSNIDEDVWRWLVWEFWPNSRTVKESIEQIEPKNKPVNGALSTTRIFYDMVKTPPVLGERNPENIENIDGLEHDDEPIYTRLYEKVRRHKDGTWEPEAYGKNVELQQIHARQVAEHGVDHLTEQEAFAMVHEEKRGYVPRLGAGPKP